MTREQVAAIICWPTIVWTVGIVGAVSMVPQLYSILKTRQVGGFNVPTFGTILFVQLGWGAHGFFTRDTTLTVSSAVSASITFAIIVLVLSIRRARATET